MADVLLPAPAWYERSGHYCTVEGERRRLNVIVPPKGEVRGLSTILDDLAKDLGISIERPAVPPCEAVFASRVAPSAAQMVLK
jgi:formate dehydrogenase major subunit